MEEIKHSFIFSPGYWFGEGKIQLNMIDEELFFQTSWNIMDGDCSGKIQCTQEIQIQGLSENMRNELIFYDVASQNFSLEMENPNIGRIVGLGIHDKNVIAWEFRENELNFEGFETYHLQSDGSYLLRAEYLTSDQFRTLIEGRIWQQQKEPKEIEDQQEGEEFEE